MLIDGYDVSWRTPRSNELTRFVVKVYELRDVQRGDGYAVEEYAERRERAPNLYLRKCNCQRLNCRHLEIVEKYEHLEPTDPPPAMQRVA